MTGDTAAVAWNSVANCARSERKSDEHGKRARDVDRDKGQHAPLRCAQSYVYDPDGNVVLSWQSLHAESVPTSTDLQVMAYQWDARGRLVKVTIYASGSDYLANPKVPKEIVDYTYDMFNNLIGRTDTTLRRRQPDGQYHRMLCLRRGQPGFGLQRRRLPHGPIPFRRSPWTRSWPTKYFGGSKTLYPTITATRGGPSPTARTR